MTSLEKFPPELIQIIFKFLDLPSLIKAHKVNRLFRQYASDHSAWKHIVLKPDYQSLDTKHLEPSQIFLQALSNTLKIEDLPLHSLYLTYFTTQELNIAIQNASNSETSKALHLAKKVSNPSVSDAVKVRYVKAILSRKYFYQWMVQYQFEILLILLGDTLAQIPERLPKILECTHFQSKLFSLESGNLYLRKLLKQSPMGALHFWQSPDLEAWRGLVFKKWPELQWNQLQNNPLSQAL